MTLQIKTMTNFILRLAQRNKYYNL